MIVCQPWPTIGPTTSTNNASHLTPLTTPFARSPILRHQLSDASQFRTNWSLDPATGKYSSSTKIPTGIPTDPPLASYGVEQAKELADFLCALEPPIDRIYSSPFYRCLQTLKPATDRLFAAGRAGGKVRVDRGLGYVNLRGAVRAEKPNRRAQMTNVLGR